MTLCICQKYNLIVLFNVPICFSPRLLAVEITAFVCVCVYISGLQFPDFIWLRTCRVEGDNQRAAEEMYVSQKCHVETFVQFKTRIFYFFFFLSSLKKKDPGPLDTFYYSRYKRKLLIKEPWNRQQCFGAFRKNTDKNQQFLFVIYIYKYNLIYILHSLSFLKVLKHPPWRPWSYKCWPTPVSSYRPFTTFHSASIKKVRY